MGGGRINSIFHNIISLPNLFNAWNEFKKGKRKRKDILEFEFNLEDNIFQLHKELISKRYKHRKYTGFFVNDPKRRHIHKAEVRDRVVHQAIFRILYPIFDKHFIYDSYSSRNKKGTHKGVERLISFLRKVSKNHTKPCFALKCDIKKFFDSIDHRILLNLIKQRVFCLNTLKLTEDIIKSFEKTNNKGLPLGNVTSQSFANIYLNELDQFIKHKLKEKYYIRYCDDFVILNSDKKRLEKMIPKIQEFLENKLNLQLHPQKIEIRKLKQGVDFLGYVVLPYYKVLRTKTKKRMFRKIKENRKKLDKGMISKETYNSSLQSYLGMLKHCKGYGIKRKIEKIIIYTID